MRRLRTLAGEGAESTTSAGRGGAPMRTTHEQAEFAGAWGRARDRLPIAAAACGPDGASCRAPIRGGWDRAETDIGLVGIVLRLLAGPPSQAVRAGVSRASASTLVIRAP